MPLPACLRVRLSLSEAIRVTFRGFARVSTQFIRRKSVLMGRLAAFTLPGKTRGHQGVPVSVR